MNRITLGVVGVLVVALAVSGWLLKRAWAEAATLEANWQTAEQALTAANDRAAQLAADNARLDATLVQRDRQRAEIAQRATELERALREAQDHASDAYQGCRAMPLPGAERLRDATRAH